MSTSVAVKTCSNQVSGVKGGFTMRVNSSSETDLLLKKLKHLN